MKGKIKELVTTQCISKENAKYADNSIVIPVTFVVTLTITRDSFVILQFYDATCEQDQIKYY